MKTPAHLRPLALTLLKITACALAMLTAAHAEPATPPVAEANDKPKEPLMTLRVVNYVPSSKIPLADEYMQQAAQLDETDAAQRKQKKEDLRLAGENYFYPETLAQSLEARREWLALEDKSADPLAWAKAANTVVNTWLYLPTYAEAMPLAREVLQIREQELGPEHLEVAEALFNLSLLLKGTNQMEEAEALMRRDLAINEAAYGPESQSVAVRLRILAGLLQDANRLADAEPLMRRSLSIYETNYGPEYPEVASVRNDLEALLSEIQENWQREQAGAVK